MSNLTERLPLTDGTNKVYDIPAAPSMVGAALGFAGDVLSGYMDIRKEEAERKRQSKAEQDKRRQQEAAYSAVKGYGEAVDLVNTNAVSQQEAVPVVDNSANLNTKTVSDQGVFAVPASGNDQMSKDAAKAATDVSRVAAAVEQGRMPTISLKAALNGKFNQLIDRYPDQAENILDIWKKMGIDTTLFREGKDLGDQLDENREAGQRSTEDMRKFNQDMFELGAKALGETIATGGANGGAMTRDEVIAHGLITTRQAHDLELQLQQINIQTQKTNLSKAEADALKEDRNQAISQTLNRALYNGSNPVINMVQNLANSILKEPNPAKQAEKWESVGARLHSMIGGQVEQAVQQAVAGGYTGDPDKLRSSLNAQFKRVEDLFSGEFSVAHTHIQALQTIQAKLKIDGSQALPVYTALKDLGMDPVSMTGFVNGIAENSELATALRNEMKGFNVDFGKDRASEHLMQVVRILRGESTLGYMSPSEARNKLPELYNGTKSLATNYTRGLGGDPEMVMTGIGELSIAANSLTPSSGSAAHSFATLGVLGRTEIAALKKLTTEKSLDPSMVTATIQASRAAGAHILNNFQANLAKLNNESPYFKIRWNDRNGWYVVDDSAYKKAVAANKAKPIRIGGLMGPGSEGNVGAAGGFRQQIPSRIPKDVEQWVRAANQSLEGLISLKDFDPSTPKATDLELRNYYGRNITPASVRSEGRSTNPDAEINKQFEVIEQMIDKNLTAANRPVKSSDEVRYVDPNKSFEENVPTIMRAEGTAQAKGWDTILGDRTDGQNDFGVVPPKPITQMTLREVFDFGKNILLPASGKLNSSAVGGLQITTSNIARFAPKIFGENWEDKPFTKDTQIALAKAIHAAQGYGAWEGLKR